MRRRSFAHGFTLLETMVTLVIVSLMIALLMQALVQVLGLRDRVLRFQAESRVGALQEQWFRESVEGAIVDLPDAIGAMRGDPDGFELVSADLLTASGIGHVGWAIVAQGSGQALVHIDEAENTVVVIEGPLQDAAFRYRASDGTWVSEWAPDPDAAEAIPRFVRFTASASRTDIDWVVPLRASPEPASVFLRPDATGF